MKNKIKMDLALLMFATVIPNTAFAQDSSNQVPSEQVEFADIYICLLYTSPSPRDA